MRQTLFPRRAQPKGFGMIEVLVALVVISVGLLGVAKVSALTIGNSRVSGSRSLGAIFLGSISSAMHANTAYWQVPRAAPLSLTITGSTVSGDSSLNGSVECAFLVSAPTKCAPGDMAAYDLRQWGASLQQLPGGFGQINCTNVAPVTCTLTIWWNEKYIASTAATALGPEKQNLKQSVVGVIQP